MRTHVAINGFDLTYALAFAALSPFWALKRRAGWRERLGHAEPLPPPIGPRLLVHGVSMGEQGALRQLVPMLTQRGVEVVVTATTDTGIAQAHKLFGQSPGVHIRRYPLDFSRCVDRFLAAVNPTAVALCELEVWPNFIARCHARQATVAVINGRLSARSFRGYRLLRPLLRSTFARLALAAVQDADYARRFVHMGVASHNVIIADTMKWDTATLTDDVPGAQELAQDLGIDRSRPLVVAGSTSEGEEALIASACPPGVQLLCAPRKPERFDAAAADMPGCIRRSSNRPAGAVGSHAGRFLLDTLGELRKAYSLADIVVVGRSLGLPGAQSGGSDPIEPVALGKPTIIGHRYENFTTVVGALSEAGALEVAHPGQLRSLLQQLISDPHRRAAMARRGRATITQHQGATARHADLLMGILGAASPPPPV